MINIYAIQLWKLYLITAFAMFAWYMLAVYSKKTDKEEKVFRLIGLFMTVFAVYGILYYTVWHRNAGEEHQFLFASNYSGEFFREMFMNGLLYLPMGLGLSVFVGPWVTLIAFLISVGIETWQYLAGTGLAQGTDVLMNTLGAAFGMLPVLAAREAKYGAEPVARFGTEGKGTIYLNRTELKAEQRSLLKCLRAALFTGESYELEEAVISEAGQQGVLLLICRGEEAYPMAAWNMRIAHEQKEIGKALTAVPYVVLKGFSAAMYYPDPLRRVMGDIDIMVRPENFAAAYNALESTGYITSEPQDGEGRHVHFRRNRIVIELHRTYASLNTKAQEKLLDTWIYDGISRAEIGQVKDLQFPVLPEPLNGLTLLAHISQHLEEGLGLRQIVDWVVYVDRQLSDEVWPEFKKLTDQLGLTKLAMAAARLGQLYLGMNPSVMWCREIDDQVCADLLLYVLDCANFGAKAPMNNTVTMVLSHGKGVTGLFRNLQKRGENNWKALKKYPFLQPFAWIYQGFRYAVKGMERDHALSELGKDLVASKRRNRLMEALEARQLAKRDRDG